MLGPFGAKLVNVSQWGGYTDSGSGDIAYVGLVATKENIQLIILGINSSGDWHRYGQGRL